MIIKWEVTQLYNNDQIVKFLNFSDFKSYLVKKPLIFRLKTKVNNG